MQRTDVIEIVGKIVAGFDASIRFEQLERHLAELSGSELSNALLECGVIPERFGHDSSEEKLWAKYCDILLAKSLSTLGIPAEVIRTRGDSADVLGKTAEYSLVGDAKAFRLSRTAKNQKDFKVSALDAWRRTNTFACLVAPLYQYPTRRSQIYEQAVARNVLLFSYVHLKFLLDYPPNTSLYPLWGTPRKVVSSNTAGGYWQAVEQMILDLTGQPAATLEQYKQAEVAKNRVIGETEIRYLEAVIQDYQNLTQAEAVSRLIKAEKIETRLETIRQVISRDIVVWKDL